MFYKDYQEAIIRHFRGIKKRAALPPRLLNPAPARVREECAFICSKRFDKKDLPVLNTFFGEANTKEEMLHRINHVDIDKLRPLVTLLKKDSHWPDDAIINLLAWLLDFPYRPFNTATDYTTLFLEEEEPGVAAGGSPGQPVEPGPGAGNDQPGGIVSPPPADPSPDPVKEMTGKKDRGRGSNNRKRLLVAASILLFAASGIFFTRNIEMPFGLAKNNQCMVWVNDHYEPTTCEPRYGYNVVALEPALVRKFQLITRPDTITERSIGKVGYISRDSKKEYYTVVGPHPVERHRHLRPLSKYMYVKYILPLKDNHN